jgi:hypothetical protein
MYTSSNNCDLLIPLGSPTTYTFVFEAAATSATFTVAAKLTTDKRLQMSNITVYEVAPTFLAATALAPDGWDKTNDANSAVITRQYKDTTYTKAGSFYSLKVVGGSTATTGGQVYWSDIPEFYYKFAGRTVTFGAWVWSSYGVSGTGGTAKAKLDIITSAGTTSSSYHTGGSTWEWLEVTCAVPSNITSFKVCLDAGVATSTAYFSQPMLVFGNSIGVGNYQPIPNEVIWFSPATPIFSNTLNSQIYSTTGTTPCNLVADTNGRIGQGVKSVYVYTNCLDSGSAAATAYLDNYASGTVYPSFSNCVDGLRNSAQHKTQGWWKCNVNGYNSVCINYRIGATGTKTFTISEFYYTAIQL